MTDPAAFDPTAVASRWDAGDLGCGELVLELKLRLKALEPGQIFHALYVPAGEVRHPAVFGPLRRTRPLARHELNFLRTLTEGAVKVALPGPYLLSRILWMECLSDRAYASREALAEDIVRVLREELFDLRAGGGACFMCGALSERGEAEPELAFARDLINRVVEGAPRDRTALHICRGNWTPDESAALRGDYRPLMPLLKSIDVDTFLLELCTPRPHRARDLAVRQRTRPHPSRLRLRHLRRQPGGLRRRSAGQDRGDGRGGGDVEVRWCS